MIALIDYGAGNLTSVRKALSALGAAYSTPASPEACATASGIIVPGVGHFDATRVLEGPWRDAIARAVGAGVPLLAARISGLVRRDKRLAAMIPDGPLAELKRLYYDTALSARPETLAPLLQMVTPANIDKFLKKN